jgi:hypothetical protein
MGLYADRAILELFSAISCNVAAFSGSNSAILYVNVLVLTCIVLGKHPSTSTLKDEKRVCRASKRDQPQWYVIWFPMTPLTNCQSAATGLAGKPLPLRWARRRGYGEKKTIFRVKRCESSGRPDCPPMISPGRAVSFGQVETPLNRSGVFMSECYVDLL